MRALIDALVDADNGVMLVLNAEGFRERYHEVFLVHLRVSLHGFVLAALRHVAQFCECLVSQLFVMSTPPLEAPIQCCFTSSKI